MTALPPRPLVIPRRPERAAATDAAALKREGIELAQAYSGAVWTDYNEHDPGVTILEQACYVLTELAYRADFPVEDLLAGHGVFGEGDPGRRFRRLASEPVTARDYRRLLIDRLPELGNAWLEPSAAAGLYDVYLYRAPDLPGFFETQEDDPALLRRARRLFVRHRGLCEDIGTLRLLKPVRLVVRADVSIDRSADADAVLAYILYRLGLFLSPEPRRQSVEEARVGRSVAEAVQGPFPENGLIPDEELSARPSTPTAGDVERHISAVPGVLGVREVSVWPPSTHLAPDQCFGLDAGLAEDIMPMVLNIHGYPAEVDSGEVRRKLKRLWEEHRRRPPTATELEAAYPQPRGRARDTLSYRSVAHHFPAVYGVGPRGLGHGVGARRHGQAKQLLGYLALFDRLMVDFLDRLSNSGAVMTPEGLEKLEFGRGLAVAVPELAPLLSAPEGAGGAAFSPSQQGRLLDFLLALRGETPDALIPRPRGLAGERHAREVKRALLSRYGELVRLRGRGFDYLGKRSRRRVSGLEARARLLLGADLEPNKRRRPRIGILEHCLLRRRGPNGGGNQDAMTVSAVVHGGEGGARGEPWRRQAAAMLRAETPAHIALNVHFVNRPDWIRFKRIRRLWRAALRAGYDEPTDFLAGELRRFLAACRAEDVDG